jgi:hypothetical protein
MQINGTGTNIRMQFYVLPLQVAMYAFCEFHSGDFGTAIVLLIAMGNKVKIFVI